MKIEKIELLEFSRENEVETFSFVVETVPRRIIHESLIINMHNYTYLKDN